MIEKDAKKDEIFIRVAYKRWYGWIFIVGSILSLTLNLIGEWMDIDMNWTYYLPAIVCLGFGVQYLRRPYFIIEKDVIINISLLGPSHKAFPFISKEDIEIKSGRVYVKKGNAMIFTRITAFLANNKDWQSFKQWVEDSEIESELHND